MMPGRFSCRKHLLRQLQSCHQHQMLMRLMRDDDISDGDDSIDESHREFEDEFDMLIFQQLQAVSSCRYVWRGPYRRGRAYANFEEDLRGAGEGDVGEEDHIPWLNEREFPIKYRCSRESLRHICTLIKDHPVIHERRSAGRTQAPIQNQLMLFLRSMGTEGSGQLSAELRYLLHTGYGTANLFKCRVVKAIRSVRE